jgi:hypothetical protein
LHQYPSKGIIQVCAGIAEVLYWKLSPSAVPFDAMIAERICVAVKTASSMWLVPGQTVQNPMQKFLQIRNGVIFATGFR